MDIYKRITSFTKSYKFIIPTKNKLFLTLILPLGLDFQDVCIGPKCIEAMYTKTTITLIPIILRIISITINAILIHGQDSQMYFEPINGFDIISEHMPTLGYTLIINYILICIIIQLDNKYHIYSCLKSGKSLKNHP